MASYESTSLWQSSLATQIDDQYEKERETFRNSYESFRTKAGILGAEIARDLPDFTVHDVTHLDALWDMASIVCGSDYKLNPAEAYVLGGAFLIHDLGMGLAAYPDGIDQLKETTLWADSYSHYEKKNNGETPDQLEKKVKELVLRELHAIHAAKLATISWGSGIDTQFLIDNVELREAYGEIIGLIAHSHWLNSEDLEEKFSNSLGALGVMPNEWTIEPLKLACIMRAADASHIDDRRAPSFLKLVRKPNAYSEQHWNFQQKLYQPRCEGERLFYSSKTAFMADEASSWWFCRDTLQMIDKELNAVDGILTDNKLSRLKAKGVAAIGNIDRLKRVIKVNGWDPIDASIHVGDVAKLVANLGGEQLYGDNPFVVLRELVQNACDAVRARRFLENESDTWGKVKVSAGQDGGQFYIEVEDNGVGMSPRVLTGPFLNFGTSFWGTSMMHTEFPGLESSSFSSTGRFGIGFFSVFMFGGDVSVTTCHYEKSRADTRILHFSKDLNSRPLLRVAKSNEVIKNGGTRVRVNIASEKIWNKIFIINDVDVNIHEVIEHYFPALDVDLLSFDANEYSSNLIKANSWKYLNGLDFYKRALGKVYFNSLDEKELDLLMINSMNINNLIKDDEIFGRGIISPLSNLLSMSYGGASGCMVVGGVRTTPTANLIGIFLGDVTKASRDSCLPKASVELMKEWVEDQESSLKGSLEPEVELHIVSIMRGIGAKSKRMKVAYSSKGWLDIDQFEIEIKKLKKSKREVIVSSIYSIRSYMRDSSNGFNNSLEIYDNVFFTEPGMSSIFPINLESNWMSIDKIKRFSDVTVSGYLLEKIAELSNVSIQEILDNSDTSHSENNYKAPVGVVLGKEVVHSNVDIYRY
jgi:hypothetical protein